MPTSQIYKISLLKRDQKHLVNRNYLGVISGYPTNKMAPRAARAKKEAKAEDKINLHTKVNTLKAAATEDVGDIKQNKLNVEKNTHKSEKENAKDNGNRKINNNSVKEAKKRGNNLKKICEKSDTETLVEKIKNNDNINNKVEESDILKDIKQKGEVVSKVMKSTKEKVKKLLDKKEISDNNKDIKNGLNDDSIKSTLRYKKVETERKTPLKIIGNKTEQVVSDENNVHDSNNELEIENEQIVYKVLRTKANSSKDINLDVKIKNSKHTEKPKNSKKKINSKEDSTLAEQASEVRKGRGRRKKETTANNKEIDVVVEVSEIKSPVKYVTEIKTEKRRKLVAADQKQINTHVKKDLEEVPSKKKIVPKNEAFSNTDCEPKLTQAAKGKRGAPKDTIQETAGSSKQNSAEPPSKKAKSDENKPRLNKTCTSYEDIDFSNSSKDFLGQPWNLKICSWNVDGIRAWLSKGGLDYIKYEKPDILCLQEVKCANEKLPKELTDIAGYHPYWLCSQQDGYAGVGLYTSKMPINVQYGIQDEELDSEGRIITAEYEQFYLICTYVPNAGRKLVTLPKKLKWNEIFHRYVKELDTKKPVIICGDMNVAHNEIDLANPKSNKKNAGFTKEERDGMTALLNDGFVDTYRHFNPDKTGAYTFWTYMMNSRSKNVGWRLDYMIVSNRLLPAVCDNIIRSEVYGSDHCPIALFLHLTSIPQIPSE